MLPYFFTLNKKLPNELALKILDKPKPITICQLCNNKITYQPRCKCKSIHCDECFDYFGLCSLIL